MCTIKNECWNVGMSDVDNNVTKIKWSQNNMPPEQHRTPCEGLTEPWKEFWPRTFKDHESFTHSLLNRVYHQNKCWNVGMSDDDNNVTKIKWSQNNMPTEKHRTPCEGLTEPWKEFWPKTFKDQESFMHLLSNRVYNQKWVLKCWHVRCRQQRHKDKMIPE